MSCDMCALWVPGYFLIVLDGILFFHEHVRVIPASTTHYMPLTHSGPNCNNPNCLQKSSDIPCKAKIPLSRGRLHTLPNQNKDIAGISAVKAETCNLSTGNGGAGDQKSKASLALKPQLFKITGGFCLENYFCCYIEKNVFQSCY